MPSEIARQAAREVLHRFRAGRWARDVLGITLDPWQNGLLDAQGEVCAVAARQVGKSFSAAIGVAHLLKYRPEAVAVAVAPSLRQSSEIVRKVRGMLLRADVKLASDNAFSLETANGSRLLAVPGGDAGTSARGYSADLLLFDEASYLPEAVVASIRPMVATKPDAKIINISSTGEASGWFYELWRSQVLGVAYFNIRATDCARISPEFLAAERVRLGETRFACEYLNEWLTGGAGWFSDDALAVIEGRAVSPAPPIAADPQAVAVRSARDGAALALERLLQKEHAA